MATIAHLLRSPGGRCALLIMVLYLASWATLMGLLPGEKIGGVPLITWSMIAVGTLAVLLSVVMIFRMDRFDRRV